MFYGASNFIFERAKQIRNNLNNTEMILWGRLKEYFPSYKFRRQHPISNYIADIYCHSLKLVIEIDGSIHNNPDVKLNDEERQQNIEMMGLTVLRFSNEQIQKDIDRVLQSILQQIDKLKNKKFPL